VRKFDLLYLLWGSLVILGLGAAWTGHAPFTWAVTCATLATALIVAQISIRTVVRTNEIMRERLDLMITRIDHLSDVIARRHTDR